MLFRSSFRASVSRQAHRYMSPQSQNQNNSEHEILWVWLHLACTGPARAILPPRDGTAEKALTAAAWDRRMRPAAPRIFVIDAKRALQRRARSDWMIAQEGGDSEGLLWLGRG